MHQGSHPAAANAAGTITIDADRVTLPPVEYVPWCEDGDGQPDEPCGNDQRSWSTKTRIEVTAEPLLRHKPKVESRAFIDVYLNRRAHSTRSLVTLSRTKEGRSALSLAVNEAERLAAVSPEFVQADRA